MRIAAVIVTFNGINYLKQCINAVRAQTRHLDEIIVVNNSSTDGTTEWLNDQNNLHHILQANSGSSGGQYTGIKYAYQRNYDWVWCLDQDINPNVDALEKLLNSDEAILEGTGFLSSLVLDNDRNISYINVPYIRNFEEILQSIAKSKNLPIISSSFGSVLFSYKAIAHVGFPVRDFFVWGDDVEYTMRMIQNNIMGYLVSSSIVVHDQKENIRSPFPSMDIKNKKTKYAIRNTFYVIRLRNMVLYKSKIRGILGCLNFFSVLVRDRTKFNNGFDFVHFLFVFYNMFSSFLRPIIKNKYE